MSYLDSDENVWVVRNMVVRADRFKMLRARASDGNLITNLNADLLDGYHKSDLDDEYVNVSGDTMTGDLDLGTNQLQFDDIYLYRNVYYDVPVLYLRGGCLRVYHPVTAGTVGHPWDSVLVLALENTTETVVANIGAYLTSRVDHTGIGLYLDMAWSNLTSAKFFDGATYTDITYDLREYYTSPTVGLMADTDDILYLGRTLKFDRVKFLFSQVGSGYTLVWEYSKGGGSWGTLSVTDDTNDFTQDGWVTWSYPSDWAQDTVDGYTGYWVRVRTTTTPSTRAYVYAVAISIFRGDFIRGTNNLLSKFRIDYMGNIYAGGRIYLHYPHKGGQTQSDYYIAQSGGEFYVRGHWRPQANAAYNLGTSSYAWNNIYYKTLNDVGCPAWIEPKKALETLVSIRPHPTKKSIHTNSGTPLPSLDEESLPHWLRRIPSPEEYERARSEYEIERKSWLARKREAEERGEEFTEPEPELQEPQEALKFDLLVYQMLSAMIELKNRNDMLQQENRELKSRLAKIEEKLGLA